jgi:hypothetical protein
VVENFRAQNIVMRDVADAISITMLYGGADINKAEPVDETTPVFRNIHLGGIIAAGVKRAGVIEGLAEMPAQGLSISNFVSAGEQGIACTNARGIVFNDVCISASKGPALAVAQARDIEIHRFASQLQDKSEPVIRFENVTDALLQSCKAEAGTEVFLQLKGKGNGDISMFNSRLAKSARAIDFVDGATESSIVMR